MEDRRPFLDLDMYKISEEDSQDEEVLNVAEDKVEKSNINDGIQIFHLIEDEDDSGSLRTESGGRNYDVANKGKLEEESNEEELAEDENSIPLSALCNHIPDHFSNAFAILFTTSVKLNKKSGRSSGKSGGDAGKERSRLDRIKESEVDVVFSWPKKVKSKTVQALVSSLGMFSTIYRLLKDVTGSYPVSSRVGIDGEITNISYSSDNEGKSLLIVALADDILGRSNGRLSQNCVTRFTSRLTQSIIFKWGSLTRAFHSTKEKEMGRFLSNAVACLANMAQDDFLFVNQPRAFPLVPKNIFVRVEELLYCLEGSDFSENVDGIPRGPTGLPNDETAWDFHCLGSILMHKGEVISSHLELSVQSQFYTWMMTELNKWGRSTHWPRLKRLVLWQPVFLGADGHQGLTGKEEEKTLSKCCHYAVLLGLDYFLLGFILEPITSSSDKFARPDTSWIRKGVQSLIQLVRSDMNHFFSTGAEGMPDRVEILRNPTMNRRNFSSNSSTSSRKSKGQNLNERGNCNVNQGKSGGRQLGEEGSARGSNVNFPSHRASANIKNLIDEFESSHIDGNGGAQDKYDPSGSDNNGPYTAGSDASSSRLSGDGSDTTSVDRHSASLDCPQESLSTVSVTKGNYIYEFVHVEYGRGVLICSGERSVRDEPLPHEDILRNFRKSSVTCHAILHKAANSRRKLGSRAQDWKWVSKAMSPISEHGTLFECYIQEGIGSKKKKKPKKVCYWVVGRLYEDQREIYICLQDTLEHQNCLELAFKIAHITDPGSGVSTNPKFSSS